MHREWTCGQGEGEEDGGINWEIEIDICTLPYRQLVGTCYKVQRAHLGAL